MNKVINIRGYSGSGKSTIIHKLISSYGAIPKHDKQGKVIGYRLKGTKIYVVGPYTKLGGGSDCLHPISRIEEIITKFAKKGNVIWEGAMISTVAGRWIRLAERIESCKFIFLILDTPLKRCLKRIRARRITKGNLKPFKPTKANLHHYQEARYSSPRNLREGGCDVRVINHKKAFKTVLKLLGET